MSSTQPPGRAARAEAWELPGSAGTEHWLREDGRFNSVRVGRKRLRLADHPFDADQLSLRRSGCLHPGPWPNAFGFCPECGARLEPADGLDVLEGWSRRLAPNNGLPVLGQALRPMPDTRRDEPMPAAATLAFVVAGLPPHLFAFDLRSGWLRVRREADRAWIELGRFAPAGLPRWSWAAATPDGAARQHRFILPTAQGPVLVRAGPDEDVTTLPASPALRIQAAAGGAAWLRGRAIAPVHGPWGLALAILEPDADEWRLAPLPDQDALLAGAGIFAAPVMHDDDAFWCGAHGLLSASATQDGIAFGFVAWGDALSPLLGARPLQAPDGRLYQLARLGEDRLVFEELALPGRVRERRPASSPWISSGNAAFVDGRRRRLPWEDAMGRAEYMLNDGEFVLPLLAFDDRRFLVATCPGRPTLGRFLGVDDPPDARPCALHFTAATRTLEPLQRRIEAGIPSDIVPFVFRHRLFVHAALANQCWSWELRAIDPG